MIGWEIRLAPPAGLPSDELWTRPSVAAKLKRDVMICGPRSSQQVRSTPCPWPECCVRDQSGLHEWSASKESEIAARKLVPVIIRRAGSRGLSKVPGHSALQSRPQKMPRQFLLAVMLLPPNF